MGKILDIQAAMPCGKSLACRDVVSVWPFSSLPPPPLTRKIGLCEEGSHLSSSRVSQLRAGIQVHKVNLSHSRCGLSRLPGGFSRFH